MLQQNKAIVFTDPDHNVDTCQIVRLMPQAGDPEQFLEHLKDLYAKGEYPHNPANGRIINIPDDIPTNQLFRNAWTDEFDTSTVDVNLDKAKAIHMERIREKRDEALKATDTDLMIALSKGEETKDVQEEKQLLRDIPQEIEATVFSIETIEALECCWPEGLELHEDYKIYNDSLNKNEK